LKNRISLLFFYRKPLHYGMALTLPWDRGLGIGQLALTLALRWPY